MGILVFPILEVLPDMRPALIGSLPMSPRAYRRPLCLAWETLLQKNRETLIQTSVHSRFLR
jgi:hypothetical protein